jgi:hypothetical protein
MMFRLILFSLSSLFFFSVAQAETAFIYYKNSGTVTTNQYTNLKNELEGLGFTVTGSTSGTVSSTDISGKDLVIDIAGSSNCGSTCKTNYDNYVSGGGKLLIVGSNGATNRNTGIEALIESKMSVGSFTQGGGCSTCYVSTAVGDYASSTSSENTLPGSDKYMYNMSGGTPMTTNGSSSTISIWYKWDYGSNGGSVAVTFGYGQFLSTHTYANNMDAFLARVLEEEGLYTSSSSSSPTPSYSSGPTSAQQTRINTAISNATTSGEGSKVDVDVIGNNNAIYIDQAGEPSYLLLDVMGNTNVVDIDQDATGTTGYGHYSEVIIDGDRNDLDLLQSGAGNKAAFVDIDGDDNVLDIIQKDGGNHYLQLDLIGDDHDVDITQEGSGGHAATIELTNSGGGWDFDLTQSGNTNKTYSLPHSMSDGTTTSGTCSNVVGCSLSVIQND